MESDDNLVERLNKREIKNMFKRIEELKPIIDISEYKRFKPILKVLETQELGNLPPVDFEILRLTDMAINAIWPFSDDFAKYVARIKRGSDDQWKHMLDYLRDHKACPVCTSKDKFTSNVVSCGKISDKPVLILSIRPIVELESAFTRGILIDQSDCGNLFTGDVWHNTCYNCKHGKHHHRLDEFEKIVLCRGCGFYVVFKSDTFELGIVSRNMFL